MQETHQTGVMRKSPSSAPQARKSCEQGFDNVKNLWGRRGRDLSPERFPPDHLLNEKSSSKGLRFCVVPLFQKGSTERFYQRIESWSSQSLPSSTTCTATTPSRESAVSPTASSKRCATRSTSPSPDSLTRLRLMVISLSNSEQHLQSRMDKCLAMMEAVCSEEMVYSDLEFINGD